VINSDVVNVDKNEMKEFWKDAYEDAKIFKKKKKKLHERFACRRDLLNSRLELILSKEKSRKSALFKIEEVSHLGKANMKDGDGRLFSVNGQKLKFHFGEKGPNVANIPFEDPT
ncbi:Gag-Pol polyprotein, partial [Melia azedarach]